MYNNDQDKSSEKMIGEAVFTLLKQDASINHSSLIKQLKTMAAVEKNPARLAALDRTIAEVNHYQNVQNTSNTFEIRDCANVTHLFTAAVPTEHTKKH